MEKKKIIAFRLSQKEFSFIMENVLEISEPKPVFPVPLSPPHLKGVFNLRGNIIPLFDLKKRIGIEESEEYKEKFFIILSPEPKRVYSCEVDMILGAFDCEEIRIGELPDTLKRDIDRSLLSGQAIIEKKKFLIIDPRKIPGEVQIQFKLL
ncbi:MAG: chemotaxis protein CheW [Candidatus Hydrothermales bacterium]